MVRAVDAGRLMGTVMAAVAATVAPIIARLGSRALVVIFTLLRSGMIRGIEEAMILGREVIAELANAETLTNDQKRSEAFARIMEKALAAGYRLASSEINLAIELLVAEYKRGLVA